MNFENVINCLMCREMIDINISGMYV